MNSEFIHCLALRQRASPPDTKANTYYPARNDLTLLHACTRMPQRRRQVLNAV